MAHTILERLEFETLTGFTLDSETDARFNIMADVAIAELEQLLGWPLDPDSWDNQYIEIGKSRDEFSCPDIDSEDLEAPDTVIGKYRIYTARKGDVYLNIDPALAIHAVKIVRNGVTCKTYDVDDYRVKYDNGNPQIIRYIELWSPITLCGCLVMDDRMEVAIDADWAYEEVPIELKKMLSAMMLLGIDSKSDVKSESVVSHSYTKFDKKDISTVYERSLRKYAGPKGTAKRKLT